MISKAVELPTSTATTSSVLPAAVDATHRPAVAITEGSFGAPTSKVSFYKDGIHNNLYIPENRLGDCARSLVFIGGSAIRSLDRSGFQKEFCFFGAPVHNS